MSISDIDWATRRAIKTALMYLVISILCAFFGAVYERFSHEVYSYYMIYAFAFPLVGGVLPFLVLALLRRKRSPKRLSRNLYHSGIVTLTVGSVVCGILDIYGTTNSLTRIYWIVGGFLIVLGIVIYFLGLD